MKIDRNKKYATVALYACGVAAFAIVFLCIMLNLHTVWAMVRRLMTIVNPIIYGFVIAFVINPLVKLLENRVFGRIQDVTVTDGKGIAIGVRSRKKLRRILSMILSYLLVFAVLAMFITLLVPQVGDSYSELEGKMTGYISGAQKWAESVVNNAQKSKGISAWIIGHIDIDRLSESVVDAITDSYDLVHKVSPYVVNFITSIIDSVKNALIGIIISIYFLYSKERLCSQIRKITFALFNDIHSGRLLKVTRKTSISFEKFISGKLLDSLIIGFLTFFVLMIFNMPFYPLIAVIVGVTNIIPFFGPFIGAIPSAFIIFVADPMKCIWFVVIIIIIQQLDGNIIGPSILGGQTGLSALWVVISIIIMGGILGITGMFIGVPVVAVLYSLCAEFVSNRLKGKGRAINTETYFNVMNVEDIPSTEEERCMMAEALPTISREKLIIKGYRKLSGWVGRIYHKVIDNKGKKK